VSEREDRDRPGEGRFDRERHEARLGVPGPALSLSPEGGAGLVYALRASVEVLAAPDGRVYLLRPGTSDLVLPEPDPVDRALLDALVEPSSVEALATMTAADPATIQEKLDALDAVEVLTSWPADTPPLSDDVAQRFDRQLPYLAEFGAPAELQRALGDATVAIIGCGGLGTWALGGLACAGIGNFVLVDDDTVEPSNLNRQVLYVEADIGRSKVERAGAWLRRFAPTAGVTTIRQRIRAVEDACEETQMRTASSLYDDVVALRQRSSAFAMTLGPAAGAVGTLLSLEVMHALLGRPAATESRAMLFNIQTFETTWEPVERNPACAVCGLASASRT
jgi:molybdopterin/thiamine biosynthesis adenylyltransferase